MSMNSSWMELPAVWMRGGTSKCWIFDADRLAETDEPVEMILNGAFGSGDARQIDGVGGGSSTTSKAMIVRRAGTGAIDVSYTFAQVGIADRVVEWGSNCGNCASAVGLYAVQEGLVPPDGDETTVRMVNTNTGARLDAIVATPNGRIPHLGPETIPGVSTGGVPVRLRFAAPLSGAGRSLLPTGEPRSVIASAGRTVPATIVDAGAMCSLVDAASLGLRGDEGIDRVGEVLEALVDIRRRSSVAAGLSRTIEEAQDAVPKVGMTAPPVDYFTTDGEPVSAASYDLAVRMISMHQPHPAIGLTSAVAVAVAALTPGTIPYVQLAPGTPGTIRLGTPSGVVAVTVDFDDDGEVSGVSVNRSARRLSTARLEIPRPPATHEVAPQYVQSVAMR